MINLPILPPESGSDCDTLLDFVISLLTCAATVVVDGNKTKDLSHVEAGLKGYVFDSSC